MLLLSAPLPADDLNRLYAAQESASQQLDAAYLIEDVMWAIYGFGHAWTIAATNRRRQLSNGLYLAQVAYAAATYDPLDDWNYVGSRHNY